ncbi:Ada metal-binding domain-containing protein [Aeromonas sp. A-5]|uniref:Ada metal-binding domain-containing protein n=1 Tax=Aeromonas ichthyocola TaxID=3367746 RepID=UPI0038EB10AB
MNNSVTKSETRPCERVKSLSVSTAPEHPYSLAIYSSKAEQSHNPDEVISTLSRQCHAARLARDARFDGRFFTGVLSTGIYCRPVCPARPPHEHNVQYFQSAAAAEQHGLRPCLRCRPELAPAARGDLPVELAQVLARIERGELGKARSPNSRRRPGSLSAHCGASSSNTSVPRQSRWSRRAACCSRSGC